MRHIHEDQIDGNVWTIPAENMKGRKDATNDFRVRSIEHHRSSATAFKRWLFVPSVQKGVLSDMAMSRYMECAGLEARPHGFRSNLREVTNVPHDVVETILGHVLVAV